MSTWVLRPRLPRQRQVIHLSTFHAVLGYTRNVAVQKSFINRVYGGGLCHWVRHDPLPTLAASSILRGGHWDQVDCKESREGKDDARSAAVAADG